MSTEIAPRELTQQQQRFVTAFTSGPTAGNARKSAVAAGYNADKSPSIACALVKHPGVSLAIDEALREVIGTTLTVQAVACIGRIINDEDAPLKLRGEMSAKVLEYSGVVERTKLEKARKTGLDGRGAGDKRLSEMTREELEALVRGGAEVLQAAAALPPAGTVIEGHSAPNSAPTPAIAAE